MRTLVGAHIKQLWTQGGLLDAHGRRLGFIGDTAAVHGRVTVQDNPGDVLHTTSSAPNLGPPYTYAMVRTLYARYNFVTDDQIANAVFYPTGETADDRINRNVQELNDGWRTWDGLETSISGLPGAVTPAMPGGDRGRPLRWFQDDANSQTEIEVPNLKTIEITRSIDQDAAELKLEIYNQRMYALGARSPIGELGQPGYFTSTRGEQSESHARWHQVRNEWNRRLRPMAILRTYQGYGGHGLSIADARDGGFIVLTGIWFIDNVVVGTDAIMHISARDPMKLLIDQQVYPPLVPHAKYPLKYYRFQYFNEAIRAAAHDVDGITYEPIFVGADKHANGVGYITNDGFVDVDAFGDARVQPRNGGTDLNTYSAAVTVRETKTGLGYWVLNGQGQIACYGDAGWYRDPWSDGYIAANTLNGVCIDMAVTPTGLGYWVLDSFGHTFAYGDATVYGEQTQIFVSNENSYLSIEPHPTVMGYWVLDRAGNVIPWGGVTDFGSPDFNSWTPVLSPGLNDVVCLRATKTGLGYWVMSSTGQVQAFGDAVDHGSIVERVGDTDWQNKYWKLLPQDDGGYLIMKGDGHIFPVGTIYYFGDATPGGQSTKRTTGNYVDYADIIKDLAGWSGFLLQGATSAAPPGVTEPPYTDTMVRALYVAYGFDDDARIEAATFEDTGETAEERIARNVDELNSGHRTWSGLETSISILPGAVVPGVEPVIYGNIESTGTYSPEALPDQMFDKHPVIDVFHQLKDIVAYDCWCDDEGALRFECVDDATEILTKRGWLRHDDLQSGDQALARDRDTGRSCWTDVERVNRYDVSDQQMVAIESRSHSSLTTPNHRWWVESAHGETAHGARPRWRRSDDLRYDDCIPTAAEYGEAPVEAVYADEFVELVGWWVTEGSDRGASGYICQSHAVNPFHCDRIQLCFEKLYGPASRRRGSGWARKQFPSRPRDYVWTFGRDVRGQLYEVAPNRVLAMAFLLRLTAHQLRLLIDTCKAGDGHEHMVGKYGPYGRYTQKDAAASRSVEIACVLAGVAPRTTVQPGRGSRAAQQRTSYLKTRRIQPVAAVAQGHRAVIRRESYTGVVWCPTLAAHNVWLARRNGTVFFTGNSPNIWGPGNFNELGEHLDEIPQIDERVHLSDYQTTVDDKDLRSEIIISSEDPEQTSAGNGTTVTTRIRPSDAADLRGLTKPAMWVEGHFTSRDEQRLMAELIAVRIHFQARLGQATFIANPLLSIGDQVRIVERITGDTYTHFLRSITSTMDLDGGTYTMQATTNWLGDGSEWGLLRKDQASAADWAFRLSQKATDWLQRQKKNPTKSPAGA